MSQFKQYYPEFEQYASHDPTYFMPIVVILANYYLLHKSEHPFLVNVR